MNLSNWKITFFSIATLILLLINSSIITDYLPERQTEPFFALALLGRDGMAENYYPGEEPSIYPDTPVKWHVYIYNHMGESQQIKVKIKMINEWEKPEEAVKRKNWWLIVNAKPIQTFFKETRKFKEEIRQAVSQNP